MDSGGDGNGPSQPGRGLNLVLVVLLHLCGLYAGPDYPEVEYGKAGHAPLTSSQRLARQAAVLLRQNNWRSALRFRRVLDNIGLSLRLLMLLALLPLLFACSMLLNDTTGTTYVEFALPMFSVLLVPLGVCLLLAAAVLIRRGLAGRSRLRLLHVLARPKIYERWLSCLVRGPEFYAELPHYSSWLHKLLGLRAMPRTLPQATRFLLQEVDWLGPNPTPRDSRLLLVTLAVFILSWTLSAMVVMTALNMFLTLLSMSYYYPDYILIYSLSYLYVTVEAGITFLAWRYEPWFSGNWRDRVLYLYLLEHLTAQLRDDR